MGSLSRHTLSFKHYSQVEDNFAQKHVFECCDGSRAVDGVVALEGLKEVGVGRLPVLLLGCVDDPCDRDDTEQQLPSTVCYCDMPTKTGQTCWA